ncbi:MAG TPA: hypothetical protein VGQ83_41815 [Polyangia bacterium]|jgi:hypothetical protein
MQLSLCVLAYAVLAVIPVVAAAEEAPPCTPATAADSRLVEVQPSAEVELHGREGGGVVKSHVINRTSRIVCRVLLDVTLDGKARPGTCYKEDGVKAGGEADVRCHFTLLQGEGRRGVSDNSSRRPGQPAKTAAPPRVKVKVTGLTLADVAAYRAWEARRVAAARKAIEAAEAARGGFRQSVKLTRGKDKEARWHVERAMTRLKDCLVARAQRNPRLVLSATLRLAVSRPRNTTADGLLAVKVLNEKGLAPARDCIEALDLIEIPAPTEFEAIADVSYSAGSKTP